MATKIIEVMDKLVVSGKTGTIKWKCPSVREHRAIGHFSDVEITLDIPGNWGDTVLYFVSGLNHNVWAVVGPALGRLRGTYKAPNKQTPIQWEPPIFSYEEAAEAIANYNGGGPMVQPDMDLEEIELAQSIYADIESGK